MNWDAKFAEVIVDINGSVVTRRKGNNLNEYEIDGMLLKAFWGRRSGRGFRSDSHRRYKY